MEMSKPDYERGIETDAALLHGLLACLPFPVWLFDAELNLVMSTGNQNWFGLLESSQLEYPVSCGPGVMEFIQPRINQCIKEQRGRDHQGWIEIEKLGRSYVLFHFICLPGELVACVPVDLTDYKQLENLLFNSECKIRTLVETIPDGVWVHDHNLIITYCNEGLCRLLGKSRNELAGRQILEIVAPECVEELLSTIQATEKDQTGQCEVELSRADGERVTVMISSAGMTGADGSLTDYLAVIKDISRQKETSEALIESERRYQAVVEDQQELICRFDREGRLTFANQAYCRFANLPAREVLGSFFARFVPSEDLPAVTQLIERVRDSQDPATIEHRVVTEDGETRWLQWQARIISSGGDSVAEIQAVGRDITERKVYYQEILKYQEQLRSLVAELALAEDHERRRIAADLHGNLGQTLEELGSQLDAAVIGRSGTADMVALKQARELTGRALDQCRGYACELSPQIQHEEGFSCAVEWLVKDATERFGIRIEFQDDQQPKPIAGDVRVILFQALRDALSDLAEGGMASEIHISLSAANGELKLQLTGNVGIDRRRMEQDKLRLFSVRERLGIVGGRAELLENDKGQVCLRFQVPVLTGGQQHTSTTRLLEELGPGVPVRQIDVLLVDDQVMMREGMRSLVLRDETLNIVGEAGDGQAAVDLAVQLQPDIVLIDESTGGLGPCETIRRIKSVLPDTRVIAMSLSRDNEMISALLSQGAEGFIFKDYAHLDLKDAIRVIRDGSSYLSPEATLLILNDYLEIKSQVGIEKPTVLTPRELEVLSMLSDGMSTKGIARKLGLSIKTIETHRRRISTKLGLNSIAELTRYAIKEGVTNISDK